MSRHARAASTVLWRDVSIARVFASAHASSRIRCRLVVVEKRKQRVDRVVVIFRERTERVTRRGPRRGRPRVDGDARREFRSTRARDVDERGEQPVCVCVCAGVCVCVASASAIARDDHHQTHRAFDALDGYAKIEILVLVSLGHGLAIERRRQRIAHGSARRLRLGVDGRVSVSRAVVPVRRLKDVHHRFPPVPERITESVQCLRDARRHQSSRARRLGVFERGDERFHRVHLRRRRSRRARAHERPIRHLTQRIRGV